MTGLVDHLARIVREQALERARRCRSQADARESALPARLIAVTPCGDESPTLEVVGESGNYPDAIARGAARVFARERFDDARAVILIAEGWGSTDPGTRPSEHPDRVPLAFAVAVTLDPAPVFRFAAVNARTLEIIDAGNVEGGDRTPIVAMLERVALSAEPLRQTRRTLGIDAPE